MKLSTKMIVITVILIVVVGLLTMGAISTVVEQAMTKQLEEQGLTLTQMTADNVANPLLDGNLLVVQRMIENVQQTGSGISYIYVIGNKGEVVAHTFSGGFPVNLLNTNILGENGNTNTILLNAGGQDLIKDVGVKVIDGLNAELHMGFSQSNILQFINNVRKLMLNLTLYGVLLGSAAALILSNLITKPLKNLAFYALRLGKGDLEEDIVIKGHDEIAELAKCLNRMRKDLAAGMQKLLRRNRELAALNELSTAISKPMNLKDKLEAALITVLQVVGKQAGWIFVYKEKELGWIADLMCYEGIPQEEALAQTKQFQKCSCFTKTKADVQMHYPLSRACPLNQLELADGSKALYHVYVPLIYKDRVLGVLNIIGADSEPFAMDDLRLLNSIGMQLGVAVENAELWEELNRKEMLRKQLLSKVITAQEEERKRISRELHDETSQSIAALGVGLKSAIEIFVNDHHYALRILEDLKTSSSLILKELHHIIYDLRPSLLDDLGLLPAIRWYGESRLGSTGIKPHITFNGNPIRLADEVEITIFRIVQESIINAAKYSNAQNLYLNLEFGLNELIVIVEDDGIGFDIDKSLGQKEGEESFGLLGMKERADLIGGTLEIQTAKNQGTRIELNVYLHGKEDEHEQNYDTIG